MKIVAVETISLDVPFSGGHSPGPVHVNGRGSLPMLFVRVETDEGLTGWGEAFAYSLRDATRLILRDVVAPRIIGTDLDGDTPVLEPVMREMRNALAGPLTYALSGIDIALWDIAARLAGSPLSKLLNTEAKRTVPAYASLVPFPDVNVAVSASQEIAGRGYGCLKLHETEVDTILAVRNGVAAGCDVAVDVSSAWDPSHAMACAARLSDAGIAWLEEPTWPPDDHDELDRVGRAIGIPVSAGENAVSLFDFAAMSKLQGLSILQPSVAKINGVTGAWKAMHIAADAGKRVIPHVYYLGPGLMASLQMISAFALDAPIEHPVFDIEADPYSDPLRLVDGAFAVPQGPGVGPAPDPEFLERYRQR